MPWIITLQTTQGEPCSHLVKASHHSLESALSELGWLPDTEALVFACEISDNYYKELEGDHECLE